jgi:hypothetical protein
MSLVSFERILDRSGGLIMLLLGIVTFGAVAIVGG